MSDITLPAFTFSLSTWMSYERLTGSEAIAVITEFGFIDFGQYLGDGLLHHPVDDPRDSKVSRLAPFLRYLYPEDRFVTVLPLPNLRLEIFKPHRRYLAEQPVRPDTVHPPALPPLKHTLSYALWRLRSSSILSSKSVRFASVVLFSDIPHTLGSPCLIYTPVPYSIWTSVGDAISSTGECHMGFLFVRPEVCRRLSSDSSSRRTPLSLAMYLALSPVLGTPPFSRMQI